MIILKYKEWVITNPKDAIWVYDCCEELPKWDETKHDYVFKRQPKRIDAQKAREIISKEGLKCVCKNEHGRIYA
jgi:hypothetical protein